MCLHIFAPGKKIQLDYVAETISIAAGGSIDVLDILFTNHSGPNEDIDRIHVVYPHCIPMGEQARKRGVRYIKDLTWTLSDKDSNLNRFYQTEETHLTINNQPGVDEIVIEMPNPNNITAPLPYTGLVKGRRHLTVYQPSSPDSMLNNVQWDILSALGWSVFTIRFEEKITHEEPRWLRLQGRNGIIHQNEMHGLEYVLRKLCGLLTHTFEIAGPMDVRHRIISALKGAGVATGDPTVSVLRGEFLDLQNKLLTIGMEAANTETVVKDWRINVFTDYYRKIDEPSFWGDIKPAGGLSNPIRDRHGNVEVCLQWKAGEANIDRPTNKKMFGARIRAHDIPLIVPLVPWIALLFAVTINLDKVAAILRRTLRWFLP